MKVRLVCGIYRRAIDNRKAADVAILHRVKRIIVGVCMSASFCTCVKKAIIDGEKEEKYQSAQNPWMW